MQSSRQNLTRLVKRSKAAERMEQPRTPLSLRHPARTSILALIVLFQYICGRGRITQGRHGQAIGAPPALKLRGKVLVGRRIAEAGRQLFECDG